MKAKPERAEADLIPTRKSLVKRLKDWEDNSSWQTFFDTYWRWRGNRGRPWTRTVLTAIYRTPGDKIVTQFAILNTAFPQDAFLIDNDPATQFWNGIKRSTFTITPSAGGTIVSALSLTSAASAPESDPAAYKLEGFNDGTNFDGATCPSKRWSCAAGILEPSENGLSVIPRPDLHGHELQL